MTPLRDLQRDMGAALLGRNDGRVARASVLDDGVGAEARLRIYRHHVATTLTAALHASFPVVCRLVDERFFAYAADEYIRHEPPAGPCLVEYGETFPAFLERFPACAALPYLADVARLEWAMNRVMHAPDEVSLPASALRGIGPDAAGDLVFAFAASVSILSSAWPVDAIWRANQPGAPAEATVDLQTGGVALEVRRVDDDVVLRALTPGVHAFRRALASGSTLAIAAERALAVTEDFDLAGALAALFEDRALVAFTRPSTTGEHARCETRR